MQNEWTCKYSLDTFFIAGGKIKYFLCDFTTVAICKDKILRNHVQWMRTFNICHSNLIFSFLWTRTFDICHSILIFSFSFCDDFYIFHLISIFFHFFLRISTFGSSRGVVGSVFFWANFYILETKKKYHAKCTKVFWKFLAKLAIFWGKIVKSGHILTLSSWMLPQQNEILKKKSTFLLDL